MSASRACISLSCASSSAAAALNLPSTSSFTRVASACASWFFARKAFSSSRHCRMATSVSCAFSSRACSRCLSALFSSLLAMIFPSKIPTLQLYSSSRPLSSSLVLTCACRSLSRWCRISSAVRRCSTLASSCLDRKTDLSSSCFARRFWTRCSCSCCSRCFSSPWAPRSLASSSLVSSMLRLTSTSSSANFDCSESRASAALVAARSSAKRSASRRAMSALACSSSFLSEASDSPSTRWLAFSSCSRRRKTSRLSSCSCKLLLVHFSCASLLSISLSRASHSSSARADLALASSKAAF
mmetsp:Transcript_137076/g.324759  ORF Transcript_137076/g.324759 Transcript_137076/m.324759 type:complete len:299 (-) Transcript_137076:1077-1973(-)